MSRTSTTSGAAQTSKTTQATAAAQSQQQPAHASVPLEKVAARAYQKWMQKGCKHGNDQQDWIEAEAELKAELAKTGAKK